MQNLRIVDGWKWLKLAFQKGLENGRKSGKSQWKVREFWKRYWVATLYSCVDALHLSQHFFILVRFPVFLGWTSTNARIKCLVQGHTCNALLPVSLEQTTLPYIKSNTLFLYKNKDYFAFKLSNVLFVMLILVKMPTVFAILTFISSWNFILDWVEHKNTFITLMPGVPSLSAYP